MTDITELALRLKLEVLRAVSNFNPQMNIKTRDLKELVEALEKAQTQSSKWLEGYHKAVSIGARYEERIAELEEAEQKLCAANVTLDARAELAERRLAEMESRTVTMKQGEVLVTVAGFTGCGKSAIAGEIEIAMKAIGVPVTWANGDSEKRMTGADWLNAIEMYKPTVRIVEENIPRATGIKWEAE
ncbi:ead/Ea22-like family protein [Klebsiella pneumoniae]